LLSFEEWQGAPMPHGQWQGAPMPHGQSLSNKELVSFSNKPSEMRMNSLKTLIFLPFHQKSWRPPNIYFAITQLFMDLSCAVPMATLNLRINLELRFVGFPKLIYSCPFTTVLDVGATDGIIMDDRSTILTSCNVTNAITIYLFQVT
jgi:hypothetical protein